MGRILERVDGRMTDIDASSPEAEAAATLSSKVNYERLVGQVTHDLRRALAMIESKFCYMRWEGLALLLELVETALSGGRAGQERVLPQVVSQERRRRDAGQVGQGAAGSRQGHQCARHARRAGSGQSAHGAAGRERG